MAQLHIVSGIHQVWFRQDQFSMECLVVIDTADYGSPEQII